MKVWLYAGLSVAGLVVWAGCWLFPYYAPLPLLIAIGVNPDLHLLWNLLFWAGVVLFVGFGGLTLRGIRRATALPPR